MSKLAGSAFHPTNGSPEPIYEGFSWPCLLFGCFWFAAKDLWGWALVSGGAAFFSFGLSWLVFPFFANALYANSLLKKGYLTQAQARDRQRQPERSSSSGRTPSPGSSVADELTKLVELRRSGVLTAAEFEAQKARVLRT